MKKYALLLVLFAGFCVSLPAQVKIGGAAAIPHPSAVLELDGGNNRGLLLPRMRKMDIDAIVDPAEGLTIYATDEQAVYLRKSGAWEKQAPFSLPFTATLASPSTLLDISNTGEAGTFPNAIRGSATKGIGLFGVTERGIGVRGFALDPSGKGGSFSNFFGGAALVSAGKTGIGTSNPSALLHIDGNGFSDTAVIINDNVNPTIQFQNAGINKSYIRQEGNNLVFRPNDQNSSGKVVLQSYNDGGWMFLDAEGDVSVGINPNGFTGTPLGSQMNIRAKGGTTLTLDQPLEVNSGPSLAFVNKVGNVTNEYGSIKTNTSGLELNSSSRTTFNGTDKWVWRTPGAVFPTNMELRIRPNTEGAELLVQNGIAIGKGFTYFNGTPKAALDIDMGYTFDAYATKDIMRLSGEDMIIRLQNVGTDVGFIQLVNDDMKAGTFATNTKGRFIIRTNNADRLWVDSVGYVTIGGKIGPTLNGPYKLAVKGRVAATDFNVVASGSWPDYVFADDYKLKSLEETEAFIKANKHLPNIPAAALIEKEGFALGDMQKRMMEKIEELTLHLIESNKQINQLTAVQSESKQQIDELKQQVKMLQPKQ